MHFRFVSAQMKRLVRGGLMAGLSILLTASGHAGAEGEPVRARKAWMTGYLKVEAADKAIGEKRHLYALELYREALSIFREVQDAFPDWNRDLVTYRITFCQQQIRNLESKTDVAPGDLSKADLTSEVTRLRQVRDRQERELAEAKTALAMLETKTGELRNALDGKNQLEAQLRQTEKQRDAVDAKAKETALTLQTVKAELQDQQNETAALRNDLQKARDKKKALEKQLEALEHLRETAEQTRDLQEKNTKLKQDLGRIRSEKETLTAENKTLERRANAAEAKTAELTAELANLTETAAEMQQKISQNAAELKTLRQEKRSRQDNAEKLAQLTKERKTLIQTRDRVAQQRDLYAEQLQKFKVELKDRDAKINALQDLIKTSDSRKLRQEIRNKDDALQKALTRINELLKRVEVQTKPEADSGETDAAGTGTKNQFEADALLNQGVAALREGDRDKALELWKKALELAPRNPELLGRVGKLLVHWGEDVEGTRYLLDAYRLGPDNPDILLPLGYALLRQEKAIEAVSILTRGVVLAPGKSEFRQYLGMALSNLGWPDAAEDSLKKALEIDGTNADAAYNLAVLLATLDKPRLDEARAYYQRARKLGAPQNAGLEKVLLLSGTAAKSE